MLDMDGTILDLAFDNYVWKQLVVSRYAEHRGLQYELARKRLFAKYAAIQGDLEWYCLDHWSDRLGFDVLGLHREVHDRIEYAAFQSLLRVRAISRQRYRAEYAVEQIAGTFLNRGRHGAVVTVAMNVSANSAAPKERAAD